MREYDGTSGEVVWEYAVPLFGREPADGHGPEAFGNQAFAAVRLASGNTLLTTGNGHSVLEVVRAVEQVTGEKVPYTIGQRRAGDPPALVADSTKLQRALGWRPRYTDLAGIVATAWEFEKRHSAVKV